MYCLCLTVVLQWYYSTYHFSDAAASFINLLSRTADVDIALIAYSRVGVTQQLQTEDVYHRPSTGEFHDVAMPFQMPPLTMLLVREYEMAYSRPILCPSLRSILLARSRYIRGWSEQFGGESSQSLACS